MSNTVVMTPRTIWLIALFCALLVGGLARLFVLHARAIRRDMNERFDRLQSQLEEEAKSLVKNLADENRQG